jgi:hypothetical protein
MSAPHASRRGFLGGMLGAGLALVLRRRAAAESGSEREAQPATASHPGFFTDEQRAALAALADSVLPGAAALGAVEYIEQLLTAFDFDPPRIHAGGPFSGRRPFGRAGAASDAFPPADFQHWVPLDRVGERAWRLRLYGSQEGDPLGPVTGLRPLLEAGAARAASARSTSAAWSAQTDEFRARFAELVLEASACDPVYAGNRGEAGWRALHFEGDSLPLGFMPFDEGAGVYRERPDAPYSRAGGDDPAPLDWRTRVQLWYLAFLSRWLART